MRVTRFGGVLAWLGVAFLASCAHKQSTAERPQSAAEQSQAAYQSAAKNQQELAQTQQRLQAAHKDVETAQQHLQQAQAREEQERAKMQELQQRVNQDVQQANQRALQAQASAEQAQGLQGVNGQVVQASPSRLILQAQDGRTYVFRVDQRTSVTVGADRASIADIQQGADARVAYDPKAQQPTAVTIRVTPAGTQAAPPASAPPPASPPPPPGR